jgi:putative aldouronate transport system permease protein
MFGVMVAFKNYSFIKGILGSPWAGTKYFKIIFSMPEFYRVLRNTLLLNVTDLLFSFPMPIILAILLAEMKSKAFKKTSQTILYLPYFISWVVIAGIVLQLFSPDSGIVNIIIRQLGGQSVAFLTEKWHWLFTYCFVGVWQSAGWNSILFIAAIAGINPELYEVAVVDGAGRFSRIWHITLPGISPTIVMLLILRVGALVSIGFERPYLLSNTLVREFSDVISVYVYRVGLEASNFSLATAVGLFQSVIGMILLISTNAIANKINDSGIF